MNDYEKGYREGVGNLLLGMIGTIIFLAVVIAVVAAIQSGGAG